MELSSTPARTSPHVTRIHPWWFFVEPGPIFQSPPSINHSGDGANNRRIRVYRLTRKIEDTETADHCHYCRGYTSRSRDEVLGGSTSFLVLIKKSHKAPRRHGDAATMIYWTGIFCNAMGFLVGSALIHAVWLIWFNYFDGWSVRWSVSGTGNYFELFWWRKVHSGG